MIRLCCEVTLHRTAFFHSQFSLLVINQSEGCIADQPFGHIVWSHLVDHWEWGSAVTIDLRGGLILPTEGRAVQSHSLQCEKTLCISFVL